MPALKTPVVGEEYTNLQTGSVVRVLDAEGIGVCTVATVADQGRLIRRRVRNSRDLHGRYLNNYGIPRRTGYVRTNELPDAHQFAPKEKVTVNEPELDEMDDDVLAAYALRKQSEMAAAKTSFDSAKEEIRRRTQRSGTHVFGNVAVISAGNSRFDGELAKKILSEDVYREICVPKPDSGLARAYFGKNTPSYQALCKEGDWKVTVRFATEEDRTAAQEQRMDEAVEVRPSFAGGDAQPPF